VEARYSDHPIGAVERDAAVGHLTRVRADIDALLGPKKVTA
jgi:hypothetical protein